MFKTSILGTHTLAVCTLLAFASVSSATTIAPGYQTDHYNDTAWVITQINGQHIPTDNAPTIKIINGNIFVDQACHSFMMATPDKTARLTKKSTLSPRMPPVTR